MIWPLDFPFNRSGFGPAGEGFVRASAFGSRENILEAVRRFKEAYGKRN